MRKMALLVLVGMLVVGAWAIQCPAEEKAAASPAAAPAAAPSVAEAPKILGVGDRVAEFKLADGLTGKEVSFEKDYMGKTKLVAISFMNTSCSACNAEIRLLSVLAGKNPDLKVIGMAVDSRGEAMVKSYNENNKFNVSYVLDPEFTQPRKYGFNFTPGLILADSAGKIVLVKGGYNPVTDGDAIRKEIESRVK